MTSPAGRAGQAGGTLLAALPEPARRILDAAAAAAERRGETLYLVGGAVRDLLLGRPLRDLDLTVEGDGEGLARDLAAELGGEASAHAAFGTAELVSNDGVRVDVATSRREAYPRPGALPAVRPAPFAADLARRDFTVNAVGLRLGDDRLIDPHGGLDDLRERRLRVLHAASFRDDPSRILRGARLADELGFDFEPGTEGLARAALASGGMDSLSGARLRGELFAVLAAGSGAVARLAALGALRAIEPELGWDAAAAARLEAARLAIRELRGALSAAGLDAEPGEAALLALAWPASQAARERLARRLDLTAAARERLVRGIRRLRQAAGELATPGAVPPHRAAELLAPLAGEELVTLAAVGGGACEAWVRRDLSELRTIELQISGDDLRALGVAPGRRLGEALRAVRRARLDGEIAAGEELDFARRWLGRGAGRES